jgi:hypothetical protein
MFFILEGTVRLHAGPRPPAPMESSNRGVQLARGGVEQGSLLEGERIAGKGDVFGEGGLFPEELGPLRLESARTLSFVSAFVLTAASMREIEAEYPAVLDLSRPRPARPCSPRSVGPWPHGRVTGGGVVA